MKTTDPFKKHQEIIAIRTLKTNDIMVHMLGGISKNEAVSFLKSIGYTDKQIEKLSK